MILNLEDIKKTEAFIRSINHTDLKDIELYHNGIKIEIDKELMEEWRFVGLSNYWFFTEHFDELTKEKNENSNS